jgi:hypothetical protein
MGEIFLGDIFAVLTAEPPWTCWNWREAHPEGPRPRATVVYEVRTGYGDGPGASCVSCAGHEPLIALWRGDRWTVEEQYWRWANKWEPELCAGFDHAEHDQLSAWLDQQRGAATEQS